ncbi:MAG: FAD/NAD(P)-binding protein, partial [Planctomycetota bacterium]
TDRLVHTVRAVGSVTQKICAMKKGDPLGVRGPFGAGWPVAAAEGGDMLVVAGGLGLAPLRPVVYAALCERDKLGRVSVLVGARAPEELSFAKELEKWRSKLDVRVTVDRAGPDWKGDVGVVTRLIEKAAFDPARATAYVCGPEIMMRFAARALEQRGLAKGRIHVSLERNMKCAVGFCGHCQLGPEFLCRDGPVLPFDRVEAALSVKEL